MASGECLPPCWPWPAGRRWGTGDAGAATPAGSSVKVARMHGLAGVLLASKEGTTDYVKGSGWEAGRNVYSGGRAVARKLAAAEMRPARGLTGPGRIRRPGRT